MAIREDLSPIAIYDAMKKYQELESDIRAAMRKSQWLKSLTDHIFSYNQKLIEPPRGAERVCSYSGTGPAVTYKSFTVYSDDYSTQPPTPCPVVGVDVEIEFVRDEDYGDNVHRTYTFQVPIDLITTYSEDNFKVWINEIESKKEKEIRDAELAKLEELMAKYPEDMWGLLP